MLPKKTIAEGSLDVVAVLESLNIQIGVVGSQEVSAQCPFHKDSHPSFSINRSTYRWICFQCSERGGIESLIRKVKEGVVVETYLRPYRVRSSAVLETRQPTRATEPPAVDPYLLYAQYESFKEPPAWALESRSVDSASVAALGVRWDRGWILPVWRPYGERSPKDLWGWQFKRMGYVHNHPPGMQRGQTLFGLTEAVGPVGVLVESPLDVVRLVTCGVQGGVASFGALVSEAQLRLLVERFDRIVVALDGDLEGRKQAGRLYKRLRRQLTTDVLTYPEGVKDVGEMSDDQIKGAMDVYR